jgi:hypothetical protein
MNGDGRNKVFFQRSGVSNEYVFFKASNTALQKFSFVLV